MLNFQCRQPNRTTMARTLNLAFLLRQPLCCQSQRQRGLGRSSTAACLLITWVRIPPAAWMSVCCVCFVLSVRGLCDELISRPEASYRLWYVAVCDIEISWMRSHTSINSDWTYEISSLEETSPRYGVYKLDSQPASTSAYRIPWNLIAD